MKHSKNQLIAIAKKVSGDRALTPSEIQLLTSFQKEDKDPEVIALLKKSAVPGALITGFIFAVFPEMIDSAVSHLPSWTNMPSHMLSGADYIWNIIGEPVGKSNILYHLPNIVLYSFGFVGIKKLIDALDRKTWIDRVKDAKTRLTQNIENGTLHLTLPKGHSVLFTGNGDFIGMQFVLNHPAHSVVIAQTRPSYTDLWNFYNPASSFEDLETVIDRTCQKDTGEYVFFPVKDDQIFLPSPSAYDLSPHKLDILCQDVRSIEKSNKWKSKRILIVGDRFHKSYVQSEDKFGKLKNSEDTISLETIAGKYPNVSIIDPTDIVLSHIVKLADGRKIVFRATKEGIREYKMRFFERLGKLKYKEDIKKKGILTIGYDIFEDQTEQQTLARTVDDYIPVVLSKSVHDALIRNGYKRSEFIYVPDLVLKYLTQEASEQ